VTAERDEMARIIQMSCRTRMSDETARGYADNLVRAGYGKLPTVPSRESPEWAELVQRSEELGTAVALWQNAKDAYVAKYPKDKQN
jgi:hypothetical protein